MEENKKNRVYKTIMLIVLTAFVTFMITIFTLYSYFDDKEKVNIDDASHIVAVTRNNFYKLPYKDGKNKYRYVVTALDRLHNESKSVSKKVKL